MRSSPRNSAVIRAFVGAALVAAVAAANVSGTATRAEALPAGFQDTVALRGLAQPTAVRFAADGRVFVAEKAGVVKVFENLADTTPAVFADLRTNVYGAYDRGLLSLALHPNFPATPYVYVLYTYNAAIGGTAPRWADNCPDPPGTNGDGCVVSGRLSRLEANGDVMAGAEQVLVEDWCQQYNSHSVGDLAFGADGALYVSGGDGASYTFADYGQKGDPLNPCGDPPGGAGAALTLPTAEGGALRSQDLRTAGDPVGLDGTILRVNPDTGAGLPNNPLAASADPNARRVVASGLRNPFRITTRPGTNEVWLGDVGWNVWEEIDRVASPADGAVDNFGWPCYEGAGRQAGYDGANLNVCENLYAAGGAAVTPPYFTYRHADSVVAGDGCPTGSSSTSGVAFYEGGSYPADYDGALFFADYTRKCVWVMRRGSNGLPDPATRAVFTAAAATPVDLRVGPGGDLFYADIAGGTIHRIRYTGVNNPPTAAIAASPLEGVAPLLVAFDGTGSNDADPTDTLAYAWDLDGDGAYDDSTAPQPSFTYTSAGTYTARLRVSDPKGATDTASVVITVGDSSPPSVSIAAPAPGTTWAVGERISFSGSATDRQDGALPASALTWTLVLNHCSSPTVCHEHPVETFDGVASGSFPTPDHEYPSYLVLRLRAVDSSGLEATTSVRLDPRTVDLTFATNPPGLSLVVGGDAATTPFTRTVIVGSANSVIATSPQDVGTTQYGFVSWSDGGAQSHVVRAGTAPATYTAAYAASELALSVGDASVTEGAAGTTTPAAFAVSLSAASSQEVRVGYATTPGTAAAGSDYTATSGTLAFAPGETTKSVAVPVLGDGADEPDEAFTLDLSSPVGATLADGRGTGTIVDDDAAAPTPTLAVGDARVTEGPAGATAAANFAVSLSAASASEVRVGYATANGTAVAGSDYTATSGTLVFAPGETAKSVAVPVLGDATDEADEAFALNLSSPAGATIADGAAAGTIVDDDPAAPGPTLGVGDVVVTEGAAGTTKRATFQVALSAVSGRPVSVKWATANGTAVAPGDYTAATGTVTIPAGATSATFSVTVKGDAVKEANETYKVDLSGLTNANYADAQGLGTIVNDD